MRNVSRQLRRTGHTGTAQESAVFVPHSRRAANRTNRRQEISVGIVRSLGQVNLQNFRDNLPSLSNQHGVTNPDVPLGNKILIMERCVCYRRSCQTYGPHNCLRCQHAGPAHLNNNILHNCRFNFRRILIGSCPTWKFCGCAQAFPQGQIIYLNHCAINITGQMLSVFINRKNLLIDCIHRTKCCPRNHLKLQFLQIFQRFCMSLERYTFRQLDIKNQYIQSTFCSNFGV